MSRPTSSLYEAKLQAWEAVGVNRPTRLVDLAELTGDITFEGHVFQLEGGHPGLRAEA